ncbi:MAG: phosphoglycerate kinase [Polyangiaceae bacterium]
MSAPNDKSAGPGPAAPIGSESASRPAERRPGQPRTIADLSGQHLRVFLHADPYALHEPAAAEAVPPSTLRGLLERGQRVFVGTELTRAFTQETNIATLEDLAEHVSERLNAEVLMPEELVGDSLAKVSQDLRPGQICLLPDLSKAEADVQSGEALSRRLATYLDAFVGDAFSVSHLHDRGLSSLPRLVRQRVIGYRMQYEVERLREIGRPESAPLVLVVGGERFADKASLLSRWLPRASHIVLGGGVANTLLAALGHAMGQSTFEPERVAEARTFMSKARSLGVELILPMDLAVRTSSAAWVKGTVVQAARTDEPAEIVALGKVREEQAVVDLGPESIQRASEVLGRAGSALWWGPLGRADARGAAASTSALAQALGSPSLFAVAFGGDLRRALIGLDPALIQGIELISTGSNAAQTLLAGRRLPGADVGEQ